MQLLDGKKVSEDIKNEIAAEVAQMKAKGEKVPHLAAIIVGKMDSGGKKNLIMEYYRHIDRDKIQFDFICDDDSTNIPYDEIEKLGGKVILIPPYQKVFKYQKEFEKEYLPIFKYEVENVEITKTICMEYGKNTVGIQYKIKNSGKK